MKTKKIILMSLLLSVALVISLLEFYIPIPIPNVRLGLSNVVIINSLLIFGFKDSMYISLLKSLLLVIILANPISFLYNFIASLFSITIMFLLQKYFNRIFSLVGISVAGSVIYIFIQIVISVILLNTYLLFTFVPLLCSIGVFTGIIVGVVSTYMNRILRGIYVK
ncbi:MAG: Gx transporter family protein [Peptoniphilaceae bacterium]|uniref:Gx transporter family protein n=1 Tax=Parvimonas sp. TaxID=1944660 RepID=UPI002A757876|nr:Gx transporter family protein [Parvimonas sp.]MDD7765313.1 Gx transporter family protein [Peptoniphilaceae bacterium]MDY3050925.1 Gx transporter family protein [Parvimonas sp.]